MQRLDINLIKEVKRLKTKRLEEEMRKVISTEGTGYLFICPFCNYSSKKNKKGSATLFQDNKGLFFKCFACGKWRVV